MKYIVPLILLISFSTLLCAQDKHFTQFYASPLTLNPALTGAYNGKFRVSSVYRDQWRGVLDNPYTTFTGQVDVKFNVNTNSRYKDAVAIGLMFFNDQVSGIDFATNEIALSAAFHKSLDYNNEQILSIGIQGALAQRNVNYENLVFDDQFNSIDAFSLGTLENLPENNFSFGDLNVGLNYTWKVKKNSLLSVGAALHHILTPQLSFYENTEEGTGDSKLYRKYSGQISYQFPVSDKVSLIPRVLFSNQGPHARFNAGTNVRFSLNNYNGNAFQIGTWVRPVATTNGGFDLDAAVFLVGFEMNSVRFGLSYDAYLGDIRTYRQGQGAFEFSIAYLGDFDDEGVLCPSF